jgi:hypothetical protein
MISSLADSLNDSFILVAKVHMVLLFGLSVYYLLIKKNEKPVNKLKSQSYQKTPGKNMDQVFNVKLKK